MEGGELSKAFDNAILFTRGVERVQAAAEALKPAAKALQRLYDLDGELEPEVASAFAKLTEVMEALDRAHTFLVARYEAAVAYPPTEKETE